MSSSSSTQQSNRQPQYLKLVEARTVAIANGIDIESAKETLDLAEGIDVVYIYHVCSEAPVFIGKGTDGIECIKRQEEYDSSDECWECPECQEIIPLADFHFELGKQVSEETYRRLMGNRTMKPATTEQSIHHTGPFIPVTQEQRDSRSQSRQDLCKELSVNYIPDISFNLKDFPAFSLQDAIAAMDFKAGVEAYLNGIINSTTEIEVYGYGDRSEAWVEGYVCANEIARTVFRITSETTIKHYQNKQNGRPKP